MTSDNKDLMGKLFLIALPVMFESLIQSSLGFLDTLMIGQLGQAEIAAVGAANQVYFLIHVFFFGVNSGASIFLAQFFGAKEFHNMRKVTALAVTLAALGALATCLAGLFCPEAIMSVFSKDPTVVDIGVRYLRIVAPSYLFEGLSMIFTGGFRAENDAKTPLRVTTFALLCNAILNYLLIFGPGPLPAFGVEGGAVATLISRFLGATILVTLSFRKQKAFTIRNHRDFKWSRDLLVLYAITALPVVLNESLWAFAATLYKVAYSKLGTEGLAAANITGSVGDIFFTACLGLSAGASVILGNVLGEGNTGKAIKWGIKLSHWTFLICMGMGLIEALSAPILVKMFHLDAGAASTTLKALLAMAFIQPFESTATVLITGILRSGGNTRFPMVCEAVCLYFIGVPVVFLGVFVLHLPLYGLYLLKLSEILVKGLWCYARARSGKWAKNITVAVN